MSTKPSYHVAFMRCGISAILLLTCASGLSCANAPPEVTRVRFVSEERPPARRVPSQERDVFAEITLDRPLEGGEIYPYRMKLVTKDGRSLDECEGNLANDISINKPPLAQTFRQNLLGSCIYGGLGGLASPSSRERRRYNTETVMDHVGPGKVQSVLVVLGARNATGFKEVGRWTFGPL